MEADTQSSRISYSAKDQSSAVIPAEIDPLIFYAAANDKGPFPERNERARPLARLPFPGRTIDIIFTRALAADSASARLSEYLSLSLSFLLIVVEHRAQPVKLSSARVNMYTRVKERRQTASFATGEGNNSKEQRKIPSVIISAADFAKVLPPVRVNEADASLSLCARRYFYAATVCAQRTCICNREEEPTDLPVSSRVAA